jgi:cytochrome d ubiquinol oxidase subunit II
MVAYALLGACWAAAKTDGATRSWALRVARGFGVTALGSVGLVWALFPSVLPAWPVVVLACLSLFLRSVSRGGRRGPFLWVAVAVAVGLIGLAASLYPLVVPPSVTAQQAAAPRATLWVMFLVMATLIPVLVAYNAFQFWVFRGQVAEGGYDEKREGEGIRGPSNP